MITYTHTTALGFILLAVSCLSGSESDGMAKRGGFVLQFDDGWTSWRSLVAPELARVGGKATGFVNNQYIQNGRVTLADLRALQDEFGWEIGTHTYNHHNAIRYVQQHGLADWTENQLTRSLNELRHAGIRVSNLVFPFNVYSPEISRAALAQGIDSYRRADAVALAAGRRADGSLPATAIDLTRYLPLAMLKQWVDLAHAQDQLLFLYGHRILPDDAFVVGRVVEVTDHELVADIEVTLPQGEDVVLVPDIARRSPVGSIGSLTVNGRRIRMPEGKPHLSRLTAPGATFLIGPAYGTRLSDFSSLVEYASKRLTFYTVSDIVAGKHKAAADASGGP